MLTIEGGFGMKISPGKKILAVLAFWGLTIFGGSIVMLWNALSPYFAQYRPGDLGYLVLQTVSTAIGAALAVWAADSITDGKCNVLCIVNCSVAATFCAMLTWMNLLLGGVSPKDFIGMGLATAIFAYNAYSHAKSVVICSEAESIRKKYEDVVPVMELFGRFAKAAGMTIPEYTRYIRTQEKMSQGMSESEAIRAIEAEDRVRK